MSGLGKGPDLTGRTRASGLQVGLGLAKPCVQPRRRCCRQRAERLLGLKWGLKWGLHLGLGRRRRGHAGHGCQGDGSANRLIGAPGHRGQDVRLGPGTALLGSAAFDYGQDAIADEGDGYA